MAVLRGGLLALPVLALGLWSQLWLERAIVSQAEDHARERARLTARALDDAGDQLAAEIDHLCRFDRRTDRLHQELLDAPPRADARRSLAAMVATLRLSELEVAAAGDASPPLRSRAEPASSQDDERRVHLPLTATCPLDGRFELRARRPYVVGTEAEWTVGEVPPQGGQWLRVWPDSGPSRDTLWLRVEPPGRPVAAVQAGTALGVVLAFGLALLSHRRSTRASPAAESTALTALTAIERATERVARGDLASHIGVTTGTPADRTLTAFNRMTEELRVTRQRLMNAERAAAWQDMARRIAHEIKNPLSPIRTAMETLRKAHARGHQDFDEIFEESSLAILEEVERLQHIVREFSEFARLPRPVPGAIDMRDTAQHAIAVARHGGVPIALRAEEGLPAVRADREQLTQVLLNLLQNACAAADEARGAEARVELWLSARASGIEVAVHDNGPGVPVDTRDLIFQPYFTQRAEGSGLGLTIAARIVEEHGATLEVDDSALGGARFTFELPLDDPASAPD